MADATPKLVIADETIVCRCEEISAASIRAALHEGAITLNDIKRRTRAGMGLCQGVYCMRAIRQMVHAEIGQPIEGIAPMTARPPARIIPLSALARLED